MSKAVWLCAGLAGGVLLTLGVQSVLRVGEDMNTTRAPVRDETADLRAENERLREEAAKVAKLQEERLELNRRLEEALQAAEAAPRGEPPPPAPEAPSAPPTDDEIMKGVETFGASLGAIIQGGGGQARKDLRDLIARAGEHGVELLVAKFEDDATDIQMRAVLAHALAQSGSPEAVATLKGILADPEAGMLEMRLASHGLAFSDAEGIDDALLATAHKATDTGARANAAFGLARRKHPEGVGLYAKATDEAMANRDPAALQYLSGFFLLGDEGLPPMRERLLTYTEPQAVLTLIEILKMKGDKGAIGNLRKLAADEGRPESTRKAAEGALKVLEAAK
ncbi:MAG: hypothetical protein L6Q95_00995 [Planctomycetes bacterium]|nr:hypothetical protein [Planctomycetota bacterium]